MAQKCYTVMTPAEKEMWRMATLKRLEDFVKMPTEWQREANRKSLHEILSKNDKRFRRGE